ncbi:MAG: hypothetical protein Q7S63_00990 [bacterium]|nr:hypothetical protein [bacterium]
MTSVKMQEFLLPIVEGPPELDLILALFRRQEVDFTAENIGSVHATIISVARGKEGAGSWLLHGKIFRKDEWGLPRYSHNFSGSYKTRERQGSFTVYAVVKGEKNSLLLLNRVLDLRHYQELAEELDLPVVRGIRRMPHQNN